MVTINAATLPEAAAPITIPGGAAAPLKQAETRPRPAKVESTAFPGMTPSDVSKNVGSSELGKNVNLDALAEAVQQLDNVAKMVNRSVHFKINESGKGVQVLVVNVDTEEVIREIPPDDVLELAERIQGTLGLLIDKVA